MGINLHDMAVYTPSPVKISLLKSNGLEGTKELRQLPMEFPKRMPHDSYLKHVCWIGKLNPPKR